MCPYFQVSIFEYYCFCSIWVVDYILNEFSTNNFFISVSVKVGHGRYAVETATDIGCPHLFLPVRV